jgi:hypothetical protein
MPSKLLSARVLLCEKVLFEFDNVISVIRLVDLFFVPPDPSDFAVLMQVLVMCSFEHDDESDHVIHLSLKRPDGSEKTIEFPNGMEFSFEGQPTQYPGVPKGYSFAASWGVKATHMGLHEIIMTIDGDRVASTFFSLTPTPQAQPSGN